MRLRSIQAIRSPTAETLYVPSEVLAFTGVRLSKLAPLCTEGLFLSLTVNHALIKPVNHRASRKTHTAGRKRTHNQADPGKTPDPVKCAFRPSGTIQTLPDPQNRQPPRQTCLVPGDVRETGALTGGRGCVKE